MTRVSIAAGTRIAAEAGAAVADAGGNAVDAAIAATAVSMCTDIGLMSPGAGAFVTIWPADEDPVVVDGQVEMPGRGLPADSFGRAMREVAFDYGGEMRSLVGYGSVATPGAFAALARASHRHGALPWARLLQPAIDWTARGFPLTGGAAEYLRYTHRAIYSWHADSSRLLHRVDGEPLHEGDLVQVPYLCESLRAIAETGGESLYGGELGRRIGDGVRGQGGLLGEVDLAAYRAVARRPITVSFGDWSVATNPPPAVGGACLAAMLALLGDHGASPTSASLTRAMTRTQKAVLGYRARRLDGAHERLPARVRELLHVARRGDINAVLAAPSTMHVSAVDGDGLGCAITASGGYGSGAMVAETGFWLNNSLGEIDLHPGGLARLAPGTRLASNMAPTVARRADGAVIAIGSPGASRITTAIAQVMHNFVVGGMDLDSAIERPRLHVELDASPALVAVEPGVSIAPDEGLAPRPFVQPSMYFGGVQAALWSPRTGLTAVADKRRGGSVAGGGAA